MDLDYAIALSLQSQNDSDEELRREFESGNEICIIQHGIPTTTDQKQASKSPILPRETSIIDEIWELIDPNPDIHQLFLQFDKEYFWGKLQGIEVRWSPRMTLCAGLCCYEGRGGLCSVRLSLPLLKLRPRKDLVETLLHEMIHAYLFVTQNNKDHDAHGPEFHKHMHRINKQTGANISVYHTFHDEVNEYRQHWWQCNGPCRQRPPYYGIVRRAMNREPSPRDLWWSEHEKCCGGTYTKIKEPENYKGKGTKGSGTKGSVSSLGSLGGVKRKPADDRNTISKWLKKSSATETRPVPNSTPRFPGKGHVLGSVAPRGKMATNSDHLIKAPNSNSNSNSSAVREPHPSQSDNIVNSYICKADPSQKFKHEKGLKDPFSTSNAVVTDCNSEASQLPEGSGKAVDVINASKHVALEIESATSTRLSSIMGIAEGKRHDTFDYAISSPTSPAKIEGLASPSLSMSNARKHKNNVSEFDLFVHQDLNSEEVNSKKKETVKPSRGSHTAEDSEVEELVDCPSCPRKVPASKINDHLDRCLLLDF